VTVEKTRRRALKREPESTARRSPRGAESLKADGRFHFPISVTVTSNQESAGGFDFKRAGVPHETLRCSRNLSLCGGRLLSRRRSDGTNKQVRDRTIPLLQSKGYGSVRGYLQEV
jgi:hypothetical protein